MLSGQPSGVGLEGKLQEGDVGDLRCPAFGAHTTLGKCKSKNEDAQSFVDSLLRVPCAKDFVNIGQPGEGSREGGEEVFHAWFMGDGHNGREAAQFSAVCLPRNVEAVHSEMSEQYRKWSLDRCTESCNNYCSDDDNNFEEFSDGESGEDGLGSSEMRTPLVKFPTATNVLTEAFRRTDNQFAKYPQSRVVGTTAMVALISTNYLCVGSCGDSRAVLFREGEPVVMNTEHKVDLPQEKARILNAGGTITESRVVGVLNMSRAIGDLCLRPLGVIPDPDVLTLKRSDRDEFLVMATDGLWDVMSNEEVYIVLCNAMKHGAARDLEKKKALEIAAISLCRTSLDRGSRDDITVSVIDLHPTNPSTEGQ